MSRTVCRSIRNVLHSRPSSRVEATAIADTFAVLLLLENGNVQPPQPSSAAITISIVTTTSQHSKMSAAAAAQLSAALPDFFQ